MNHHEADTDYNSAPESISDTENWLNSNGDFDNPIESEDYLEADDEFYVYLHDGIEYPQSSTHSMPLLLPVYFWDHTGSLNNRNMDIRSKIMNCHSYVRIGSTFQIS